jgi:hypothetical protein
MWPGSRRPARADRLGNSSKTWRVSASTNTSKWTTEERGWRAWYDTFKQPWRWKAVSASESDWRARGIAPDRLLRCVVLKHIKGWSYRQLHRELRASFLYRRFTRFYEDPIPDFTNLCRAFALFGKEGTEQVHQRIVQQAFEASIIAGNKLRTDTTAVETNIHHPSWALHQPAPYRPKVKP